MTLPSIEPTPISEGTHEWLQLKAELVEITKEQASGAWDKAEAEGRAEWVQSRVKRAIELTSILRRTNTGPAKPKGARASKKTKPDAASIKADLLS
jgi:hypothetical protein